MQDTVIGPRATSVFLTTTILPFHVAQAGKVTAMPPAPPAASTITSGKVPNGTAKFPLTVNDCATPSPSRMAKSAFSSAPQLLKSPPIVGTVRPRFGVGGPGNVVYLT